MAHSVIDVIGFDGDDTLWHNERLFAAAQDRFVELLSHYHDSQWMRDRLFETEKRNLEHFGYGIKAFALSMIETAVQLTEGRVTRHEVLALVNLAKDMLSADTELLDDVRATVTTLAGQYRLMLITKGDLLDQEAKIRRSGLGGCFRDIEVVSDKRRETYARVLGKHSLPPGRFLMVGNSLRSDVWPVLELGAQAVWVPYELTWEHEAAEEPPPGQAGYHRLAGLRELPALLSRLETSP
jgi:putative hydrolase of the HAD superfamily